MKTIRLFFMLMIAPLSLAVWAQSETFDIRLNQIGYFPNAVKWAAVVNTEADSFKVMTTDLNTTVFEGQFLPPAYYSSSGENVYLADFTLMTDPGTYVLVVDDLGKSVPFKVDTNVYADLTKSTLKAYYFNRASTPLLSEHAGIFAREAGHPDTAVIVLPSAASPGRPAGTKISTPGGWYDAGDYNKYIVSCGGTVFTLLSAYETYPEFYDTLNTNIPESGNAIPDILDEALYNIKWMMTMQDADGGVYNKTTHANFSGFVMPAEATSPRYVTAKGTAATLDFAAVMAMTSRIYRKYDADLADSALAQAERAWDWAKANPNVAFSNPTASGGYPGVNTGEYGDTGFDDEFTWCAAELYITTKDSNYYKEIDFQQSFGVPGWPTVGTLGLLSLMVHQDSLTDIADVDMIRNTLINATSGTKNKVSTSPYRIPGDFYYWAGNNAFANWGMVFAQVFRITGDASYYNAALASLDYLLGKNATTYCFVTGQGSKSPMNIHHRPSSADGVTEPVPGWLVGGANSGDVSDCGAGNYPSSFSAKSYLDWECSYSTNEIAIGINSGLVFLAGAVQAEYLMNFTDTMPRFFSVSTDRIQLSYAVGDPVKVVLEGNTDWELMSSEDWITLSATAGSGNATIEVNAATNNPTEEERSGVVYVYSQLALSDSILVTQNGKRRSFRIEAEDFIDKSGIQTESTADEGGGENIGYIDVDDWIEYNLDISYEGVYDMTIRHAGYAGDFDIYVDDVFVTNVTFNATDDWQVWESFVTEIFLTEGHHVMKLEFNAVGTNLNWYQFDWKSLTSSKSIVNNGIHIYPNPAKDILNIDLGQESGSGEISILSLEGKLLIHKINKGNFVETMDVSSLNKGVYLLKVRNATNTITETLTIY